MGAAAVASEPGSLLNAVDEADILPHVTEVGIVAQLPA